MSLVNGEVAGYLLIVVQVRAEWERNCRRIVAGFTLDEAIVHDALKIGIHSFLT